MTESTPGRSMHARMSADPNGIFHFDAKSFALCSVRAAIETTSTSVIFARGFTWISPIAPVPAMQNFITLECTSLPIQTHRVIDQQLLLRLARRRDLRDVVHEQAIVRHVVLQVRMRPVRTP